MKKIIAVFITAVTAVSMLGCTVYADFDAKKTVGVFSQASSIEINFKGMEDIPLYSQDSEYGFVSESCSMPSRKVQTSKLTLSKNGVRITENNEAVFNIVDDSGATVELSKSTNHNFGGMILRVKAPAGGYNIEVKTNSSKDDTMVSVSGMQYTRIMQKSTWDAAGLVPMVNMAEWKNDKVWQYNYANGQDFIDIEVEPLKCGVPVGIESVKITPVEVQQNDGKPTIYTLGDSTLKTYTYNESPMCGWAQVFDDLFDKDKVNVINYSMGGRSLKSMYQEGRLNDILMSGKKGDFVFIQSAHNDERKGTDKGTGDGENSRFGGGATEEMYEKFLEDFYIPAIRARGMTPIFVTAMSRMDKDDDGNYVNSFTNRKFIDVMKKTAEENDVILADLNKASIEYYNELGDTLPSLMMGLEAGETPGKTNSGSYANGHPDNKIDGTHFKEALAKQFSRMVLQDLYENDDAKEIISYTNENVKSALESGDWSEVYPEMCKDTMTGEGAYYRNQIEKMVKLGAMKKDENGNFNPEDKITVYEYITALEKLWNIDFDESKYTDGVLTREVMGAVDYDMYVLKFGYTKNSKGEKILNKPKYMTDYNKTTVTPDDPNYDSNLVGEEASYYPMAGYGTLTDKDDISPTYRTKVKEAYELGLIRAETGIERGKMINGTELQPKEEVTRAKTAKSLYFLWVLAQPVLGENDVLQ